MSKVKQPEDLTLQEHFAELKKRAMAVVIAIVIVFIIAYVFSDQLLGHILNNGKEIGYNIVYISPQELLVQQLRFAGLLSFIVCLPLIVVEVLRFIFPAFETTKSKISVALGMIFGLIMFIVGALFAYFVLIPLVYETLYGIGRDSGIEAMISVENYVSLFVMFTMIMGILFEIPMISAILAKAGILNSRAMTKAAKPAIVIIFIVAAIITPPDIVSQVIVAIPMCALYGLGVLLCKIFEKRHIPAETEGNS